jgi:hypothetical protein
MIFYGPSSRFPGNPMTLLISAKYLDGVILTADGRSIQRDSGNVRRTTDSLQKIFPHESLPVVMAHHGENLIRGVPITKLVPRFLLSLDIPDARTAALACLAEFDSAVVETLLANELREYCGFFLVGRDKESPFAAYAICWSKTEHGIQARITPHGPLLIGGDCSDLIEQYLREPIDEVHSHDQLLSFGDCYAQQLSDKLVNIVLRDNPPVCGGHIHQIRVNQRGCSWIKPPVQ